MKSYVCIDIETTGIHIPAKIIEIAAVKVINDEISDTLQTFVGCGESLPEEIIKLTKITDVDLIGAPSILEALTKLKAFIGDLPIIGYNIAFDMSFIKHYGQECGIPFENETVDVLVLARERLFDKGLLPNYRLHTVAEYFGVSLVPHRAENDAVATIGIYKKLEAMHH